METAVNRDYSGEILLRVSPESGRFIVEEHKKNGVVSYKEISPLDFYNTIYGSFDQEHFLRSGLLPPNCLQVSFCGEDKYFVLWNPELRADIFYGDTEYLDFPIPRMVFGIRTLRDGRAVDCSMLSLLTLSAEHRENLRERGLSDDRIDQNQYRSMPQTPEGRKLLASLLRGTGHDLQGIPGFRTSYGEWTLSGPNGFLIPVRNKDGLIQGMKIRLDEGEPGRKYRWLSSRNAPNGTRGYSWTHVTGNTASKRAYITEGPLKGDVASYLDNDTLFVCIGGVFALHGLKDTLMSLGVTEVVEAMDMDQMTNPQVRRAIQAIRREVQSIRGIRYSKYVWNPAYKGIDDYYLSRIAAQ